MSFLNDPVRILGCDCSLAPNGFRPLFDVDKMKRKDTVVGPRCRFPVIWSSSQGIFFKQSGASHGEHIWVKSSAHCRSNPAASACRRRIRRNTDKPTRSEIGLQVHGLFQELAKFAAYPEGAQK